MDVYTFALSIFITVIVIHIIEQVIEAGQL